MATKKPATLQEYIDQFLEENNEIANPKSYEEFIMHGGKGSGIIASKGTIDAKNQYMRSLSTYGKRAERLAARGLTDSGYAAYISNREKRQSETRINDAKAGALITEANNEAAYKDYLTELGNKAKKIRDSIIKKLSDSMITDYDRVYDLASRLGLSDSDADTVARLTTETAIKKLSDRAITDVVNKRLSKEQARKYAENLGLPEEEVEKIANYAEFMNQKIDYNETQGNYLDYLKDKLSK